MKTQNCKNINPRIQTANTALPRASRTHSPSTSPSTSLALFALCPPSDDFDLDLDDRFDPADDRLESAAAGCSCSCPCRRSPGDARPESPAAASAGAGRAPFLDSRAPSRPRNDSAAWGAARRRRPSSPSPRPSPPPSPRPSAAGAAGPPRPRGGSGPHPVRGRRGGRGGRPPARSRYQSPGPWAHSGTAGGRGGGVGRRRPRRLWRPKARRQNLLQLLTGAQALRRRLLLLLLPRGRNVRRRRGERRRHRGRGAPRPRATAATRSLGAMTTAPPTPRASAASVRP